MGEMTDKGAFINYSDCDICKKQDTDYCHNCERAPHYTEFEDYFEFDVNRAEEQLDYQIISIIPPEEFTKTFEAIKPFTGRTEEYVKYIPVHAAEGYLSASNSFVMAKIKCEVPMALRGRNIIRIEQSGVRVFNGPVPFEKKEDSYVVRDKTVPFEAVKVVPWGMGAKLYYQLLLPDIGVQVNAKYWDMATSPLKGNLIIYYKGELDPVTIEGENGFVLIMPIRTPGTAVSERVKP